MTDLLGDLWQTTLDAVSKLFIQHTDRVIAAIRQPTPIKISRVVTADASGNIGGGFSALTNSRPVPLWECPMAYEAWINRIVVDVPGFVPANPYNTGNVKLLSSTGNAIQYLPISGVIAPVVITEGRLSAPHLNSGEYLSILGEGLTVGTMLKFDMQIILVSGMTSHVLKAPDLATGLSMID